MFYVAVMSLLAGVFCGWLVFTLEVTQWVSGADSGLLLLMLFSVGISIGGNREVWTKLREHNVKMLVVPLGTAAASLIGGAICAPMVDLSLRESISIAASMGWYSLSSVMMTELAGASAGAVAFLANMLRELLAFAVIPAVARRFNHFTAIAPAGATSEDTTLPLLMRHTTPDIAVMAVFNGFLLSTMAPIFIRIIMGGA